MPWKGWGFEQTEGGPSRRNRNKLFVVTGMNYYYFLSIDMYLFLSVCQTQPYADLMMMMECLISPCGQVDSSPDLSFYFSCMFDEGLLRDSSRPPHFAVTAKISFGVLGNKDSNA